jgi:hypothetical protein
MLHLREDIVALEQEMWGLFSRSSVEVGEDDQNS